MTKNKSSSKTYPAAIALVARCVTIGLVLGCHALAQGQTLTSIVAGPAGAYLLGVAGSGTGALLNQYNDAITAETNSGEDRFTGYVLRVLLDDLISNDTATSGAIQYDFSPIINSLQTIQQETRGVRPAGTRDPVTLQILTRNVPPPIVMAQIPDAEEYTRVTNGVSEQIPAPWSPAAVTVLQGLYTALANTTITDYSQPGNPTVLLKDHPTLVNINNTTLGHKGFRDNTNGPAITHVWTIPGYDRDLYVANLLGTIKAIMTAFPNDFGFVEYFGFKDGKDSQYGGETLDQRVDRELDPLFNGAGQPSFGVWRENLGEYSPSVTSGQNLLDYEGLGFVNDPESHVLMQSIRYWLGAPVSFGASGTASGSIANGMLFGYVTYGTRYLETYIQDVTITTTDIKLRFEEILGHPVSDAEAADIQVILKNLLVAWNAYLVNGPKLVADSATVSRNSGANTIRVMANDAPPPGVSPWDNPNTDFPTAADLLKLTVTAVTQGTNGSVVIAANGTDVIYTPNAGFSGTDSFTYTVRDQSVGTATASVSVTVAQTTGIQEPAVPGTYSDRLEQCQPNPFNPTTLVQYSISRDAHVRLVIFNIHGQLVRTLVDAWQGRNAYRLVWDGKDNDGRLVASGIYISSLVAGDFIQTRKAVLAR